MAVVGGAVGAHLYRKASHDVPFESCVHGLACGDENGVAAAVIDILLACTAPAAVLEHSLGAVI